MSGPSEIVGYTYKAEQLCPACTIEALKAEFRAQPYDVGSDVEGVLDGIAATQSVDRDDEHSFDSDAFPKVILGGMLDCGIDADHERCGVCRASLCDADTN